MIWATNPKTESRAPADTAPAAVVPDRWKKRMLVATRAAVEGTARLMKQVANTSLVTRSSGTGAGDAVWSDAAWATRGTWPSTSAARRMGRLADRSVVGDGVPADVGELADEGVRDGAQQPEPEAAIPS